MNCSNCGTRNLRSYSKCLKCGNSLEPSETSHVSKNYCPSCGALNLKNSSSCIKCNASFVSTKVKSLSSSDMGTSLDPQISIGSDIAIIDFRVKDPSLFPYKVMSSDIEKPFDFVKKAPFINDNQMYKGRSDSTSILLDEGNFTVNAFATDYPIGEGRNSPPYIVFFEGYCVIAKICSILFSLLLLDKIDIDTFKKLNQAIVNEFRKGNGKFDYYLFQKMYNQFNLEEQINNSELRKSRSIYFSVLLDVCAHELGHICLGHTLRNGPNSFEVSRNQEREADSFASSVISESPFSDYNCYGAMIGNLIFIWLQGRENDSSEVTTHPHSEERLMYLIRANKEQFQELGINEETIIELLPGE